jgi:hypothetical protein
LIVLFCDFWAPFSSSFTPFTPSLWEKVGTIFGTKIEVEAKMFRENDKDSSGVGFKAVERGERR